MPEQPSRVVAETCASLLTDPNRHHHRCDLAPGHDGDEHRHQMPGYALTWLTRDESSLTGRLEGFCGQEPDHGPHTTRFMWCIGHGPTPGSGGTEGER
jgi:hypothetical protein